MKPLRGTLLAMLAYALPSVCVAESIQQPNIAGPTLNGAFQCSDVRGASPRRYAIDVFFRDGAYIELANEEPETGKTHLTAVRVGRWQTEGPKLTLRQSGIRPMNSETGVLEPSLRPTDVTVESELQQKDAGYAKRQTFAIGEGQPQFARDAEFTECAPLLNQSATANDAQRASISPEYFRPLDVVTRDQAVAALKEADLSIKRELGEDSPCVRMQRIIVWRFFNESAERIERVDTMPSSGTGRTYHVATQLAQAAANSAQSASSACKAGGK